MSENQPSEKNGIHSYQKRIGNLLLFLFVFIGVSLFFAGINPQLFGFESKNLIRTRLIVWTISSMLISLGISLFDFIRTNWKAFEEINTWRIIIYGWYTCGLLGLLMSSLPNFSMKLYIISLLWTLVTILSLIIWRSRGTFFARLLGVSYVPNVFFIMSVRIWIGLISFHWSWFMVLFSSYLFSWSIPKLLPRTSNFLFREQFFPKTKIGKVIHRLGYMLLPIATSAGAIGMYMDRFLGTQGTLLTLAIFSTLFSVLIAQPLSHQIYLEDPFDIFVMHAS